MAGGSCFAGEEQKFRTLQPCNEPQLKFRSMKAFGVMVLAWVCLVGRADGSNAWRDSLRVEMSLTGQMSSGRLQPLWSYANQWGLFTPFEQAQGQLYGRVRYRMDPVDWLHLEAGLAAAAHLPASHSMVHELYVKGKLWVFDFSAGMEAFSPVAKHDGLTSGSFLMSANARPVPRVGVGIFDFLPLAFTGNWVEVKGGMYQGWPLDDDSPRTTKDVWLHEKFAYVRLGNFWIQPYGGLVHSALFGGTLPNGKTIPRDFWATFRAAGSSEIGGGEATNAAGAHMGLWDFGVNLSLKDFTLQGYLQKPFADGSGMRFWKRRNHDYMLGLLYRSRQPRWIQAVSVEVIRTDHQSGSGLPDALDPETGQGIWPGVITQANYKEWMANRFPEVNTSGWSRDDVFNYLSDQWNYGHEFGGRDTYMNNGLYYQGWTHKGLSTGTPLLHTADLVRRYAPEWTQMQDAMAFVNNRVVAFHAGVEGTITAQWSYRLKYTFAANKGSYPEEYRGHYSWVKSENYYFENTKNQNYTLIGAAYAPLWMKGVSIQAMCAADFGELYQSWGGRLGITYVPEW